MNIISLLLSVVLIALGSAAGPALAGDTDQYSCTSGSGKCPPPLPPLPPVPPEPPAPPALPAIPAAAHAACAGKYPGASLTYVLGKGETVTGTCEREDGKMLFMLRSYSRED